MKILFPTDFSANAKLACDFAFDLAKKTNGTVFVLNAYDLPYSDRSVSTSLLEIMRDNAESNMAKLSKELESYDAPFETFVVPGNPIRQIKEFTKNKKMDMIVMGTQGASGLEEVLIGSNATSVMHGASCPVLIIPPKAELKPIKKITFASDLNLEGAETELAFLKKIAQHNNSFVDVVHVQKEKGVKSGTRELIEKHLKGLPFEFTILQSNNVEEAIIQEADKEHADLIAAIAKNYKFFEGLFHKSITSKLAYHTHIPLLILHEPK